MHEHDLDLIAAFAEGSVGDATEARALVESCEVCRTEYEGQQAILEILVSAPRAEMTEFEKAALHRDMWTELGSEPATRVTPWWYRFSYVAAGVFVLVGLAAVMSGLLQGADDSGEPAATLSETASGQDQAADGGGEVPLFGAESEDADERASTTAAAAESSPYPFAELAEEARAKQQSADSPNTSVTAEATSCLETLALADQQLVETLELDQSYLVLMDGDDPDSNTVTFVTVDPCEIVWIEG